MATGGEIVAGTLARLGVRTVFSVSGNQVLPVYDALPAAGIRIIHMRHESAAAYAAIGAADSTGLPGVLLVSAGPGFLAALTGVAVAYSMELPLLFLSGDSPPAQGSGAFQAVDQLRAAATVCKATSRAEGVADLAAEIESAWRAIDQGVPSPVHVALPGDALLADQRAALQPLPASQPAPLSTGARAGLDEMARLLSQSERPAVIARPSAARGVAGAALRALCGVLGVEPLVTESPRGLSDLKYAHAVPLLPQSDCTLVVAPADFAVGFLSEDVLARDRALLLIDAPGDPEPPREPLARVRLAPADALPYLAERLRWAPRVTPDWRGAWAARPPLPPASAAGEGLHPLAVAEAVRAMLTPDDIIVLDGGEFCQWVRLGLRDIANPVLWNGKLGAIGGAVPIALGVAVSRPGVRVLAVAGDGAAGYHLSEFETAARYGLPITLIIGNDARWAAEWHMQAARYGPERTYETALLPARYDEAARGFGAAGYHVEDADALEAALAQALASGRPACLNVRVESARSPATVRH